MDTAIMEPEANPPLLYGNSKMEHENNNNSASPIRSGKNESEDDNAAIISNGTSPVLGNDKPEESTMGLDEEMGEEMTDGSSKDLKDNGAESSKESASTAVMEIDTANNTGYLAPAQGEGESGDDIPESNAMEGKESESPAAMEGILEGIVTEDGQLEVDVEEEEAPSHRENSPASYPKPEVTNGKSPRKRIATKSTGMAKQSQASEGSDDEEADLSEDDKKPAAVDKKEMSLDEFQNGAPKSHKIKASKMVNLQKAKESTTGTPEDAIVLSSSEDEADASPQEFGILQDDDEVDTKATEQDQAIKLSENQKQKRPVAPQNAQGGFRARDIEVGERVYCEFSLNKRYYWGRVVNRTKKKKSRFFKYHVRFDDGDEDFDMSSTKMVTVEEYIASFGEANYQNSIQNSDSGTLPTGYDHPSNPPAAAAMPSKTEAASKMNAKDLLEKACGNCENCRKPSCGSCSICQSGEMEQCYQKMCCKIPEQAKLQSYVGLPDGMGFCFKERNSNPHYEGLLLVSKGGRKYRSFESCFFKSNPDQKGIDNFYAFVGLKGKGMGDASAVAGSATSTKVDQATSKAKSKGPVQTLTPHELWTERCGECENCKRPDCTKCICCRGNKRDPTARNCCYQKMCLKIDVTRKAQPAPTTFGNFPPGWKFCFDLTRPEQPRLKGLIVLPPPPSALRYYAVEKAVRHSPKLLANVDQDSFYHYVGLAPNGAEGKSTGSSVGSHLGQAKRSAASFAPGPPKAKKSRVVPTDVPAGLSLRDLYERRCKNCVMCKKPSCGQCQACKDNVAHTRTWREVCIQKMCFTIKEADKIQLAKGFPEGWRFYYTDPGTLSWQASGEHTGLAGLVLKSPSDREFNSVESAAVVLGPEAEADVPTIARTFYGHVGCHAVVEVRDHVLLGKPFVHKWSAVDGRTKMVYGKVAGVSEDLLSGGIRTCKVQFSEKSRAMMNAGFNPNGVSIPPTQKIPQTLAFGGCLDCDARAVRYDKVPFHLSWNVPDVRHEDFVVDEHGMFAPRLSMHFRGFHLTFTAKTSTIPNAGKGVFVSCSNLSGSCDSNDYFVLNAGELLDLGVYAPFRRSDKKTAHVFLLKNFIHSYQCEEWNFDTVLDDNLFDITDDTTGKLHEIASRHIPAYVNETDGVGPASVYAQHDPEGCVHYLLGHGNEEDGPFMLQANGVESEIFIDYGETYEDVRVRKDYSRLSEEDAAERKRQLDLDYREVLVELKTYNATEIVQCVNFMMQDVFYPNRPYPASVVIRALLATVLFRKQAEHYMKEFASLRRNVDEEEEMASVCHSGFSRDRMELVVQRSKNLIEHLYKTYNNWEQIKQTIMSNEMYLDSLEFVLGEDNYEQMPPERLGELMVGNKEYLNN